MTASAGALNEPRNPSKGIGASGAPLQHCSRLWGVPGGDSMQIFVCRGLALGAEVRNVTEHKEMSGCSRREGSSINFTSSVMKHAV